ncbi:MAG: hypothetical protein ABWY82_00710, partial [Tardiphaga sp.]
HFFRDANDTRTVIYTLELPNGNYLAYRDPEENIEGWGHTMMEAIVDLRERLEDKQDDGE